MRGVITPMVGTAMERLFMSNPNVQFDAAAWEEFTQLNEMMAMSCIDETFMELQNARGGVRNPNGLFVSKIRKFLGQMRNNFGGGHGGGHYGGVVVGWWNFGGRGGKETILITTTITSEEEEEEEATAVKVWTIKRLRSFSPKCTRTE